MQIPHTTKKHKQILKLLYQFRFLNTNQIQKLLNHKNPNRTQSWLKELKDMGYITTNYNPKNFLEKTKPAIYYLTSKSISLLKQYDDCYPGALKKIYSEKKRHKKFIDKCVDIADISLLLEAHKEPGEEVTFFTENELEPFEYFPDPLPSAYITVDSPEGTQRYFLDVFDSYTPSFVLRNKIKMYMKYVDSGNWDENKEGAEFPSILFVCPTLSLKRHIMMYTKALFDKAYEEKFDLYVTTKEIIQNRKEDIWEKVE